MLGLRDVGERRHPGSRATPSFEATGLSGLLLKFGARTMLPAAGITAPTLARLTPSRYRTIERTLARIAWASLGAKTTYSGFENIRGGPYIVMPLHESLVDPLLLAHLPLRLAYLARDEIWEWPSIGQLLKAGQHLCVATEMRAELRTATARRLLHDARVLLGRGDSLVIFPQGSVLGIEVAFNRGAFWLARMLDVPVLPVVIAGTHRVWEYPFSPLVRRHQPVTLCVLPAASPDQAYHQRLAIENEMRAAALATTHGTPRRFVPARDGFWDGYPFTIAPEFADLANEIEAHRCNVSASLLS
jgi:1-acyl-sn-glycerol-3-phosphate acyltransferase